MPTLVVFLYHTKEGLKMDKKVIISRCILGDCCRYDGKTKQIPEVLAQFKGWEIIPFCPEDPVFGTPRQRIDVVKINTQERIITHETKEDVTHLLQQEIQHFITQHPHADKIVLKSKSPSCGYNTTPIRNLQGDELYKGSGIGAKMLAQHFQDVEILDEHTLFTQSD
jgi:uncharacterized protein YbbK (DUF523 family)